ncbi:nucleoside hydrolase [Vibrio fluminensis]|uniref:nucleoside hydrolase n=1 Tax=Vibrio fluminensis TaxID=2783614 RepID=UPI001887EF1E|nr:nucleoside hydrolase [Vibrio fluminensis]
MKKLIIDCDPGHDDAIALMLAIGNRDKFDIQCISTVGGNQILEKTTNNTLKLLELMDVNIPVVAGRDKPLVRALEIADSVHGDSGIDGPELPFTQKRALDENFIDTYARLLDSLDPDEKMTFVVTGPQTNMALFLLARPEYKDKIEQILFMGGACFGGNWSPKSEFNIYVDPEAAQIVSTSGVPIVMCGLDVTHQATINQEEIEYFRHSGSQCGLVIAEMLDFFSETSTPEFRREAEGKKIRLHDVTAIAYLLSPAIFETRELYYEVDLSESRIMRGATIVDYDNVLGKVANSCVCFDIDREKFIQLIKEAVSRLP